ncbi:MAG: Hsp20/alpha crystallin family protein [Patescibacteria group bacterium]
MTNISWQAPVEVDARISLGSKPQNFEWYPEEEGQLAVDVYQTDQELIIISTIAGVGPDDIEITLNNDLVTIRGQRQKGDTAPKEDYFYQECYWGSFSRSIVLPVEINPGEASVSLKYGLLKIVLPKIMSNGPVRLDIKEE